MKGNLSSAALAIGLFGTVAFAGVGQTLLRRQLTEGLTEKYQIDMKMTTVLEMPGGLGEQELGITSSAEMDMTIGKMNWQIPGAQVETVTRVTKMEAEGMMAGAIGDKLPPPMKVKGTLDIFGRLRPLQSEDSGFELGQLQSLSFGMMTLQLPERPVKIGDSWPVMIPKSPLTKKNQFITATLKGEQGGSWLVALNGTYKLEMDPREIAGGEGPTAALAGQKVSVKGDVVVEGEGVLDKLTGRTMSLRTKTDTKQAATIGGMGISIDFHSAMESTVTAK